MTQLRHMTRMAYGDALASLVRSEGEVPVMSSGGVTGSHDSANTLAPCIVIGRKGSYGSIHWSDIPAFVIDTAYYIDRRSSSCDMRWLYYALHAVDLRGISQDVGVPGLSREAAYSVRLPGVPCLLEQRRIADFLDDQVTLLDEAISLRKQQIKLQRARFAGLREMLIEGSRERLVPLGLFVQPGRPINYGVLVPGLRLEEGVPLVEAGDIMRGPILIKELRLTEPAVEAPFKRSRLVPGDLVMAIRGSVGGVQVIPAGPSIMNVTRDAARIALRSEITDGRYFKHALVTQRTQEWLALRLAGSAVRGINIAQLRKVPIVVPALVEQRRLRARLDNFESYLVVVERRMKASIELIKERKQALITAAVTGQLDVTTARSMA